MTTYRGVSLRYGCDREALSLPLRRVFVESEADASTRAWMDEAIARPHGRAAMMALKMARQVMSDYDANGLLGAHDMRVMGEAQWRRLFAASGVKASGRFLDVGAGEGQVTDTFRPFFEEIVTTEMSSAMARRLRGRGYECHEVDLTTAPLPGRGHEYFNAIALLNVIDRTNLPYTLVGKLRSPLAPGGVLLCAVPLPLRPHVHVGPVTMDPEEILPRSEMGFEHAASTLAELFFLPCGLEVIGLTRVPYLCREAKKKPILTLDDAVFVCRAVS